jgi:hypothetical protein
MKQNTENIKSEIGQNVQALAPAVAETALQNSKQTPVATDGCQQRLVRPAEGYTGGYLHDGIVWEKVTIDGIETVQITEDFAKGYARWEKRQTRSEKCSLPNELETQNYSQEGSPCQELGDNSNVIHQS